MPRRARVHAECLRHVQLPQLTRLAGALLEWPDVQAEHLAPVGDDPERVALDVRRAAVAVPLPGLQHALQAVGDVTVEFLAGLLVEAHERGPAPELLGIHPVVRAHPDQAILDDGIAVDLAVTTRTVQVRHPSDVPARVQDFVFVVIVAYLELPPRRRVLFRADGVPRLVPAELRPVLGRERIAPEHKQRRSDPGMRRHDHLQAKPTPFLPA